MIEHLREAARPQLRHERGGDAPEAIGRRIGDRRERGDHRLVAQPARDRSDERVLALAGERGERVAGELEVARLRRDRGEPREVQRRHLGRQRAHDAPDLVAGAGRGERGDDRGAAPANVEHAQALRRQRAGDRDRGREIADLGRAREQLRGIGRARADRPAVAHERARAIGEFGRREPPRAQDARAQ